VTPSGTLSSVAPVCSSLCSRCEFSRLTRWSRVTFLTDADFVPLEVLCRGQERRSYTSIPRNIMAVPMRHSACRKRNAGRQSKPRPPQQPLPYSTRQPYFRHREQPISHRDHTLSLSPPRSSTPVQRFSPSWFLPGLTDRSSSSLWARSTSSSLPRIPRYPPP
jgi:hypothetical protein